MNCLRFSPASKTTQWSLLFPSQPHYREVAAIWVGSILQESSSLPSRTPSHPSNIALSVSACVQFSHPMLILALKLGKPVLIFNMTLHHPPIRLSIHLSFHPSFHPCIHALNLHHLTWCFGLLLKANPFTLGKLCGTMGCGHQAMPHSPILQPPTPRSQAHPSWIP